MPEFFSADATKNIQFKHLNIQQSKILTDDQKLQLQNFQKMNNVAMKKEKMQKHNSQTALQQQMNRSRSGVGFDKKIQEPLSQNDKDKQIEKLKLKLQKVQRQ